jgi:predicted outer membrane repeat protein
VTISGLSFKNGTFTNTSFIMSEGTLTVTNSVFSNNQAQRNALAINVGSSITNGGNLVVINSIFSNNFSGLGGGAIDSNSIGKVVVINSTFSNNSSQYYGDAIDSSNPVIVTNSTFSNNRAPDGGAIYCTDLTVVNSTFFNNQAESGGAIEGNYGSATVTYSTFYGNQASSIGGGILIGSSNNVTLTDSILMANQAPKGPNIAGSLTTGGYNLIQYFTGTTFLDPNGLHATDREVKLLSDLKIDSQLSNNDKPTQTLTNGGHTQTLKLQPGSPAIDAIPLAMCHITFQNASGQNMTITTDQLNDPKPDEPGGSCDIGAYESSY